MNLIEQAKQLLELPKGTSSIVDLAPILRAFLEMADYLENGDLPESPCTWREDLLKRIRGES